MMRFVALSACAALAAGHGAVVHPPPRNAVDKDLHPWNGPVPADPNGVGGGTTWCPIPGPNGTLSGRNAQSCFWFSNGCAVGCDECDGTSRGPIPHCPADPRVPCPADKTPTGIGRNKVGPGVTCKAGNGIKPTLCDPAKRSVNTLAECGGPRDWYYFSPWRAPGAAPVFDACGMAGGHPPPNGGFGGVYTNTSHARLGDRGTHILPRMPSQATWTAGASYEVSWTIETNVRALYACPVSVSMSPLPLLFLCVAPLIRFISMVATLAARRWI